MRLCCPVYFWVGPRLWGALPPILLILLTLALLTPVLGAGPAKAGTGKEAAGRVSMDIASPDRVARGDGFAVSATVERILPGGLLENLSQSISQITFLWRGKSYSVPTAPVHGNAAAVQATVLLPVPLDVKEQSLPLTVKTAEDGLLPPATVHVALFDKQRPVQKLTVDKKYTSPPAQEKERIRNDRLRVAEAVGRFSLPAPGEVAVPVLRFLRPVSGSVTSEFGMKRVYNGIPKSVHRGLDMRGAMGSPIVAAGDGEVVLADGLYYSGNALYIDHGLGVLTSYMHMSHLDVQKGQKVRRGDIIGRVGSTGQSTGPHLHWGLIVQGTAVDPVPFLEK